MADHVERVASLGMSALALSEHGNVNSHVALEKECGKMGIKPIFGVEAYFAPAQTRSKFHIGLFAMDDEGYRNLNRIVTQSYLDAYQYPTVSWESLKANSAGIAVLSGCADSLISCTLLGGKSLGERRDSISPKAYRMACRRIRRFCDVFEDRFYLETQRFSGLDRTCTLNPALQKLSADCGVPLIATADVHYPRPDQNTMQKVLHASRRLSSVAIAEAEWEYDILLTYPESDTELLNDLVETGLSESAAKCAISNTARLADRCTVELPKAKPLRFKTDTDAKDELRKWLLSGWHHRCNQRPDLKQYKEKYFERIKSELKIIACKDFCDYFLAVADLVARAKSADTTVGPGRGSAAGSLVCYVLGITEIDPLHPTFERMIFERFIDPNRSDMPDIDLDFDDELRSRTEQDAREIYGQENVANVGNHIKYRGKQALSGVARAYGLPHKLFEPIGKRCSVRVETDDRVDDSILDVIESYSTDPEIVSLVDNYGDKLDQAVQLEGNQHSLGIHAGGFVIASEPIPDVCAIYTRNKGTGRNRSVAQVIPYDKRDAEYLNMLKMDFLGLTTMGMIGLCRKWIGMDLEHLYQMFYNAPDYEHERILEMFQCDDVMGIFQYEGGTTRQVTREVRPSNFDELAACNALSRPGPFYGGQTRAYIAVKHGEKDWDRIHPNFDKHVEWTYGQIVYQEQIMWILRDIAGFDTANVLRVRKIIGKKLGEHQFEAIWASFRDGCASTSGLSEETALAIFNSIRTAAGYAFNTAHAYSYMLVGWWSGWFKLHYPTEFFAASLAKNGDGKDDLSRRTALLQDSQRNGIKVSDFNLLTSQVNWTPNAYEKTIYPGFQQIPGIGESTAQDISAFLYDAEVSQQVLDWDSLTGVQGIGEKTVESIKAFVTQEDCFGINRTEQQLSAFRKQLERGDFEQYGLPSADEFITSADVPDDNDHVAFVGLVANVVFRDEVESVRIRTGQPVDEIRSELDAKGAAGQYKKATIFAYDEHGEVALRVSRFRFPNLQSRVTSLRPDFHIVVAWGRTFEGKANSIQVKSLWILDPD